jgi:hypothetical protein
MNPITLETIKPIVIEKLQNLAQEHHRTLEEEINVILENAVNNLPTNGSGFWEMTLQFRETMKKEGITLDDTDFTNLRDRSAGREVNL